MNEPTRSEVYARLMAVRHILGQAIARLSDEQLDQLVAQVDETLSTLPENLDSLPAFRRGLTEEFSALQGFIGKMGQLRRPDEARHEPVAYFCINCGEYTGPVGDAGEIEDDHPTCRVCNRAEFLMVL